jgi:hypothetical protein
MKRTGTRKPEEFTLYRLVRPNNLPLFSLEPPPDTPAGRPPGSELEQFQLRLTPKDVVDALNIFGLRHAGERMVSRMVQSLNAGALRDGLGPDPETP